MKEIWYRHSLWVTVQYTGYGRTVLTCVLNSHLKTVKIPYTVLTQLSSWRWAEQSSKHVEEYNKCMKIKNLCIKLAKRLSFYHKKTITILTLTSLVTSEVGSQSVGIVYKLELTHMTKDSVILLQLLATFVFLTDCKLTFWCRNIFFILTHPV